jgi:hypothetical protein
MNISAPIATVIGAVIAALGTLLGLFLGHFFTRWREDRTKRIQFTIEHAEKQLSEFYSPLLALVEQLDTTARASEAIDEANIEDKPAVDRIMWEDIYSPIHEEIMRILKTKIHLIEGFDIKPSFTHYFHHYASQKIYWHLLTKDHPITGMTIVGYPPDFYDDVREGVTIVGNRYENSLRELRSRFSHFTPERPASLGVKSARFDTGTNGGAARTEGRRYEGRPYEAQP